MCGERVDSEGTRTLVVDGVPKSENGQHGEHNGRRRGILAVEVARLDSPNSRSRRGALREFGVERDEGSQVRTLPLRLTKDGSDQEKKNSRGREVKLKGELTRIEGEAILGGTRPESCRRTREACIVLSSQFRSRGSQFVLCCLALGCPSLSVGLRLCPKILVSGISTDPLKFQR